MKRFIKNLDFNLLNRIIIGPAYPLRGGISESNQSLHECFKQEKGSSQIISYSLQYPKLLFPGKKQQIDSDCDNFDRVRNMINTLNPFSWIKTARYIINEKPDYVIVRYWHPYFAICLSIICKFLQKKSIFIIAWIDNVNPHESVPFQKILTSYFLNQCDAFIVMSQSVKNDLLQYRQSLNKSIVISPHPIYNVFGDIISKKEARSKIGISDSAIINNDKYILFFGLIRKYKGLDLLIDAMSSSKIQDMNVKLIIAGEFYDSKSKYINKINHLQIGDNVLLYDSYIPNEEVVNYFCAADIVVQPYLSATQSGVSMVAYNFNKPLILTNVGGLSEYVNHNEDGYLVDLTPESIALALEDFYNNHRENKFTKAIKNKKTVYSWSQLADNFNTLYNDSTKH